MSKTPKVSIVIPCYNQGDYLSDSVGSVEAQTFKDWELFIVNDGSSDGKTIKIINDIENKKPNYHIINQKNTGLSGARNAGIQAAKGSYVVCLDADDMLDPDYLTKTVDAMEAGESSELAIVTTWLQEFGERNDLWKTNQNDVGKLLTENIIHAASIFKKSVWKEVGGYKPMMVGGYEDWEFWLSIVEKGYTWSVVPEPLFLYRIREGSMLMKTKLIHNDLYNRIVDSHAKLFAEHARDVALISSATIKEFRNRLNDQDERLVEQAEQYDKANQQLEDLRKQLFEARQELADLKGSRLIKQAIKARKLAGKARHGVGDTVHGSKHAARQAVHQVRVVGAPFVHPKARKLVKGAYRRYKLARVKTATVENEIWPASEPLLSVVISYFNYGNTIEETIQSLLSQSFKRFEIIIVDDGSTDEASVKKFKELRDSGLKATFIQQANQGPAIARNNGIAKAKGKYIICLDADDMLSPTFIEKAIIMLETLPDTALITTDVDRIGVDERIERRNDYDPIHQNADNRVIPAAAFRREAWEATDGYKPKIGYEDWEFWVTLAEKGFWGKLLPEPLFKYRTALQSRYIEDKSVHWENMAHIKRLHPKYATKVRQILAKRKYQRNVIDAETAFLNLSKPSEYALPDKAKPSILIAIPWMTFGGAETLIYNFCREVKEAFNISFVTGLKSEHEWEYKFQEISPDVYHLANLFQDESLWLEFISNYITTRNIEILHIIHTGLFFGMLPELKRRHPELKVVVCMFNDWVEYFAQSITAQDNVDRFMSDNELVGNHYRKELSPGKAVSVIPNGIDSYNVFNLELFDREKERADLSIDGDDIAVFFVGRLSEEKNPDVYLQAAKKLIVDKKLDKLKFFIIGDGLMRGELEKMIKEIRGNAVTYLGYKPTPEVAKCLSAADIFVLPSRVEGFPLSILEAMSMQLAVISSRVGAVPDIIDDGSNGFIVTPGSAVEIADTIERLYHNRSELAAVKAQARQKILEKYSNRILGKNYIKMYKETLK